MQTSGIIALRNDHAFMWFRGKDGEISGMVDDPEGRTVKGSFGWWRTNDPEAAAKTAQALYVPT